MMYGWGWGGWIVMCVVMVLFWAALITALVLAIPYLAGETSHRNQFRQARTSPNQAEDVLAKRFALGEIDEDEFQRRLMLLCEHR